MIVQPRNCYEIYKRDNVLEDGVYEIYVSSEQKIQVFCEMKKGGWTRIMNRVDQSKYFNKYWHDYKTGFGKIESNYWMGIENMRSIIGAQQMWLRIEMSGTGGEDYFLIYDYFSIGSERRAYSLELGKNVDGNTFDSFTDQNLASFSTFDTNNKIVETRDLCPKTYYGGWWYTSSSTVCYSMCLTCASDIYGISVSQDNTKNIFAQNIKMMISPNY